MCRAVGLLLLDGWKGGMRGPLLGVFDSEPFRLHESSCLAWWTWWLIWLAFGSCLRPTERLTLNRPA